MLIMSIDVGIIHLAIIIAKLDDSWKTDNSDFEIIFCELIDITELNIECDNIHCKFYHDKVMCDYIDHLCFKYQKEFESADLILIERQPISGLVVVEQLIMHKYRSKTTLISPCSVIKYFGLSNIYEQRKIQTVEMAHDKLADQKHFIFNERRHDLADAYVILLYYVSINKQSKKMSCSTIAQNLSNFVYKG